MTVPNKEETKNKISLQGFFEVASVLGVPKYKYTATALGQLPEGVEFFSFSFADKELSVYRLENGVRALETNAVTLDFLWRKVSRLVHPMMINYTTFEATFYMAGTDEVQAVNFCGQVN